MRWDDRCRWLQLCIPGPLRPRLHRQALAVEPMSCPPDAFNSGTDLVVLQPGDTHSIELTIDAIGLSVRTGSRFDRGRDYLISPCSLRRRSFPG